MNTLSNIKMLGLKVALICVISSMVIFQGCSGKIVDENQALEMQDVENFKERVCLLADKYDVKIEFDNTKINRYSNVSLKEIEQIFYEIKEAREHPIKMELHQEVKDNGEIVYTTESKGHSSPLIKTRSEVYGFSEWIWNLTWFSVTLIEDRSSVNVLTDISGLSVYQYTQTSSSASKFSNIINFNSTGNIKATITSIVGINVSYTVISSGSYNKSINEGSVNVSTY